MIDRMQLEILIEKGYTIKQIAEELQIGLNTVKRRIYKWGLKTDRAKIRETFCLEDLDPKDVQELMAKGYSLAKISDTMQCSIGKIRYCIEQNSIIIDKKCEVCNSPIGGMKKRFCSEKCKNTFHQGYDSTYNAQQKRGYDRKQKLIEEAGGGCIKCGYNRCSAALDFHHRVPAEKSFRLDMRSLSNRKWEKIEAEVEKCDLLCSNCHREVHHQLDNTDD